MKAGLFFFGLFLNGLINVQSVTFKLSDSSYALYPIWNACPNASVSFDFKTTEKEGFLFYVDDQTGDGFDFIQIHVQAGKLRMVSNIVDGYDGNVQILFPKLVNDGEWHSVKYQRNRMMSIMVLDGETQKALAFGSDFQFGITPNTYAWFGGLDPRIGIENVNMPSVSFLPRFQGSYRNIIYQNCSCQSVRVSPIEGLDYTLSPKENCEVNNPCKKGCLCISNDLLEPDCDCSQLECSKGSHTHYHLPMDKLYGSTLENYGGLDASLYGPPIFPQGANNSAVQLDGVQRYIRVSGPSHRFECFGDLSLCDTGYTMAFWMKIMPPISADSHVYLSNGGHQVINHGVALLYYKGELQMMFKDKKGHSWTASADHILPGNWYHVTAVWDKQASEARLYIDGKGTRKVATMKQLPPASASTSYNDFVLGRMNEPLSSHDAKVILLDEFHFWSQSKPLRVAREEGPLYSLKLSPRASDHSTDGLSVSYVGSPREVSGVMGPALSFDGRDDYVIIDQKGKPSCFSDLSLCLYGLRVATWLKMKEAEADVFDSGVLRLSVRNNKVLLEASREEEHLRLEGRQALEQDKWYYLEGTYDSLEGLRLFINHRKDPAYSTRHEVSNRNSTRGSQLIFIGKSSSGQKASRMEVGQFELSYGDRERLQHLNFILTGRPKKDFVSFNNIPETSSSLQINSVGTPRLVSGPTGKAYDLDGSSYVSLGKHEDSCTGNLDFCRHGALMSVWIKPQQVEEGMDLFSTGSNGLKGKFVEGKRLRVSGKTTSKEWRLFSKPLKTDQWHFVEVAWHPESGLKLYVNHELVKESVQAVARTDEGDLNPTTKEFYVGRGDGLESLSKFGKFSVDNLQYWHAHRDYLLAFGYIQRGKPRSMHISMDEMSRTTMKHPHLTITSNTPSQSVPGKVNNAYHLDGSNNYLTVNGITGGCFKDLNSCPRGLTTSFFVNFDLSQRDQYYFSNGGGVSIYQANQQKYVSFVRRGQKWEVPLVIDSSKWHFLEASWHPDKGLKVFVDNNLAAESQNPTTVSASNSEPLGDFLIGNGNARDHEGKAGSVNPGKALIDEFEMWEINKEYLEAFDYIIRDKVPHHVFPMEVERGNKVVHADFDISKFKGARLVPGRVGRALELAGDGQYVLFRDQSSSCMGNLQRCPHGVTTSFFLKPASSAASDNLKSYFLSSGAFSFFSQGPKYTAVYQKGSKQWQVETEQIEADEWQKVELSWDEEKGLKVLKNGAVVAQQTQATQVSTPINDHNLYLGRPTDDRQEGSKSAKGLIDELEFWFAHRDHLKAFDLIKDDIKLLRISMDEVDRGVVKHPTHLTMAKGGVGVVRGVRNNAVSLNGQQQYIDLGTNVICNSHLQHCANGFTTRMKLRPHQLVDGSYIFSSPFASLYQENGRLVAEVRTEDKKWQAVSAPLDNDVWSQVDMSWHPSEGVSLYINNHKEAERLHPSFTDDIHYDPSSPFYLGRSGPSDPNAPFATVDVDDFEVYEAKRDSLLSSLISPDKDQTLIAQTRDNSGAPGGPTGGPGGENRAVTFVSAGPQVSLPRWSEPRSLEFTFRTSQPDSLIFYQDGKPHSISVEMYEGIPYLNAGPYKYPFPTSKGLNDNHPHKASLHFSDHSVLLSLDGESKNYPLNFPVSQLNLEGGLLVAGVQERARQLPYYVWNSGEDSRRYLGCLWDVKVNEEYVDLRSKLRPHASVVQECRPSASRCKEDLCGDGACIDLWNSYKCHCSKTDYTGEHCDQVTQVASFNGDDQVRVNFRNTSTSTIDDFSARFRSLQANGLILSTSNNHNDDRIKVSLQDGRAKVQTSFNGHVQEMQDNCAYKLNDATWHTLHLKRRADQVEVFVDDCFPTSYKLQGDHTALSVDQVHIGKHSFSDSFSGDMRNVVVKDVSVLDNLAPSAIPGTTIESDVSVTSPDVNILYPATFRKHQDSVLQLEPLNSLQSSDVELYFKTSEPNGLMLHASNSRNNFLSVLLEEGRLKVKVDDKIKELQSSSNVADGKWHKLTIRPSSYQRLNVSLDDASTTPSVIFDLGTTHVDLSNNLFVGGIPASKSASSTGLSSHKGFTGCLASVTVNGRLYDLMRDAIVPSTYVTAGCTDTSAFCAPDLCHNGGVCREMTDTFLCDCSLTSFIGHYCHIESKGLRLGGEGDKGISIYHIEPPVNTDEDKLAFGFMTWRDNGTLVKMEGSKSDDFIEASMSNGKLQFAYDVGDGEKKVVEDSKDLNDGAYHHAWLVRKGQEVTVRVDDLPTRTLAGSKEGRFDKMGVVKVGGDLDSSRKVVNHFDGIIAGVHLNSHSVIKEGEVGMMEVVKKGDVLHALHPFFLPKPTEPPKKADEEEEIEGRGGGLGWHEGDMLASGSREPTMGAMLEVPPVVLGHSYPRVAATAGVMLGVLVAASSVMWALFKFKPGLFNTSSFAFPSYRVVGTEGKASKGGALQMSSAMPLKSQTQDSHIYDTTAAFATLSGHQGYSFNDDLTTSKVVSTSAIQADIHNNLQADSQHNTLNFNSQQNTLLNNQQQNLQQGNFDYQVFQQNLQQQQFLPPLVQPQIQYSTDTLSAFNQQQQQLHSLPQQVVQNIHFSQQQQFPEQQQIFTNQSFSQQQQSFQQPQHFVQQPQHFVQQSQHFLQQPAPPQPPFPNLMGSEEIRVDCVQLTTNGRFVVTGSIYGPPQVWDMKTGELVRIMQGDDFSSTDLHLANGDSLLIGQVADQSQNTIVPDNLALNNNAYRKLQVWDFATGKCIEMQKNELCTASCMMADGERLVLGRTERMGQGTTIVIWDILGNEPLRHIAWHGFVGSYDDPLTFITLSKDNRYIIAGTQNTSDATANYVTFDLTTTDFNSHPPNVVSFNADVLNTVVLENQEAVTGTRNGELVVWSMRTGKALRQLMSPLASSPGVAVQAHQADVTGLCVSKDDLFLVSSSSDGTLKMWNLESERLERVLSGHLDEVLCCSISNDNELVVSGSSDQTIRLWRVHDGQSMASIQTGLDVFKVLLSNNKKTIVALADKQGARKLVMLQVVRTKVASNTPSRATSPLSTAVSPHFNYR